MMVDFAKLLTIVAIVGASSLGWASELSLSYVVDRPDWTRPAVIIARLDDGIAMREVLIAECGAVSLYEIAQNPLLTDLTCDGGLVTASLTQAGIEVTLGHEVAAQIDLPDGEYWINGLPLLVGR
jgi:hypothetical protein